MPLVTVGVAPFVRSLCLRYEVECVILACLPCAWGGLRSASVPCASGLCLMGLGGVLSWTPGSSPCAATVSVLTRR